MRKKIDIAILVFVLIVGAVAIFNAHTISDFAHSLINSPEPEIANLAQVASMTNKAQRMFYRFSPSLVDQQDLNIRCGAKKLGCTNGRSIYILNFSNEKEQNQSAVTASHEMLHVAYSRLSDNQKNKVNSLLAEELNRYDANNIKDKLNGYPTDDYYDEAHSFTGTELANLSPELNTHYSTFFIDRNIVIKLYQNSP